MLDEEKFVSLGDGLYSTSDINDAYDYIGKENILTVFPDYELELFDLDYSYTLNDENYSEQWYLETIDYEFAKDINVTGKDIKIAVIDSGIGGLSVLKGLVEAYPYCEFLYFGDNDSAPYGSRSKSDLISLTIKNLSFVLSFDVDLLVVK